MKFSVFTVISFLSWFSTTTMAGDPGCREDGIRSCGNCEVNDKKRDVKKCLESDGCSLCIVDGNGGKSPKGDVDRRRFEVI